ncbi:hypothetical protein JQ554_30465 [Bradyrhizobium diazoefficiens]|nr:hypothetical protein [Bradyrhizobium diazoefficiens]MBR0968498.1 hypothetical protein [Bradyrhizobium diazoefficiens]MBR0981822.1 hypothetical protein [Bradyrhizobium diazoefficiens]MBR1011273.1 hypothetical protein [Bradyrhizobium diazoefficiens]MBR1015740.1 hypothetical protein [Bradyrhizobium diazoefficiens]MBR1055113.1 hypothetical protein [Bradyrhizobium diazoefficiens]
MWRSWSPVVRAFAFLGAALAFVAGVGHFFSHLEFATGYASYLYEKLLPILVSKFNDLELAPYVPWGISTVFALASLVSLRAYIRMKARFQELQKRFQEIAIVFLRMAGENHACDEALFECLFLDGVPAEQVASRLARLEPQMKEAKAICSNNIASVISYVADVFKECAVSVKARDSRRPNQLRTIGRDKDSKSTRADDASYDPLANTAFEHIISTGERIYACDDLIRARDNGTYRNPRLGWEKDYTATLVAGDQFKIGDVTFDLFLCIDNRRGGLDNEMSSTYAIEFMERIGVMSYRFFTLEGLIDEIAGVKQRARTKRSS